MPKGIKQIKAETVSPTEDFATETIADFLSREQKRVEAQLSRLHQARAAAVELGLMDVVANKIRTVLNPGYHF